MKAIIFILALFLAACSGCPLDVDDRVTRISDGKQGVVLSVGSGSYTKDCTIAVRHDDMTYSASLGKSGDGSYDFQNEYVSCWKYRKGD